MLDSSVYGSGYYYFCVVSKDVLRRRVAKSLPQNERQERQFGLRKAMHSELPDDGQHGSNSRGCKTRNASNLAPGKPTPNLPEQGIAGAEQAAAAPGAQLIPTPRAFGGVNPSEYTYPRVTTQRNIYRVWLH